MRSFASHGMTTIAIVAELDGTSDTESDAYAALLADLMSYAQDGRVLDHKQTRDVARYFSDASKGRGIDESERLISSAKERYFRFDNAGALRELRGAIEMLEAESSDLERRGPLLVDANLTLALVSKAKGDMRLAGRALTAALAVDPTLSLSEQDYPPSLMSIFNAAVEKVRAAPSGAIQISSKPPSAEVYLNGMLKGRTPLVIAHLPSGEYSISVKANRYVGTNQRIFLEVGETLRLNEKLEWAEGSGGAKDALDAKAKIGRALAIADALGADRLISIDVDAGGSETKIEARMVDSKYRVGLRPVATAVPAGEDAQDAITRMADELSKQASADLAKKASKLIDPLGIASPVLLGKQKKKITRSPVFWGAIGAACAGAIAGGVAAAMSGSSGADTGNVRVTFK